MIRSFAPACHVHCVVHNLRNRHCKTIGGIENEKSPVYPGSPEFAAGTSCGSLLQGQDIHAGAHCYRNGYSDCYGYRHGDRNRDQDGNSNRHAHCDGDGDSYKDSDPNRHAHCDGDGDSYKDSDPNRHA